MNRSEFDANRAMHPGTYAQGVIDGRRQVREEMQRKRDRDAITALWIWLACLVGGFATGLLTAAARGLS